jgi:hypothetical protein
LPAAEQSGSDGAPVLEEEEDQTHLSKKQRRKLRKRAQQTALFSEQEDGGEQSPTPAEVQAHQEIRRLKRHLCLVALTFGLIATSMTLLLVWSVLWGLSKSVELLSMRLELTGLLVSVLTVMASYLMLRSGRWRYLLPHGSGDDGRFGGTVIQPNSVSIAEACTPKMVPKEDGLINFALSTVVSSGFSATMGIGAAQGGDDWLAAGARPPCITGGENYYSFFEGRVEAPPNSNVPAADVHVPWELHLVGMTSTVGVGSGAPMQSDTALPDISHLLEGVDDLVPSKEYRTWMAALDVVINAPSYQYFLAYLFVLIGVTPRRTLNIVLYVKGWLTVIMRWTVDYLETKGFAAANWAQGIGQPIISMNWVGRASLPGASAAWLENNAPDIARGVKDIVTAVNMSPDEAQALMWMFNPWPLCRPTYIDPTGNAFTVPVAALEIFGKWEVGCFYPDASPAIQLAGGWNPMTRAPQARVMMSAMWKMAFLTYEGPLLLVAFIIACQMACVVTVFHLASNNRRIFTAVQSWATLTLPPADTSQFLRAAVASLSGGATNLPINPWLGYAQQECMAVWVWIGLTFHLAASYTKYWMGATRDRLCRNQPGKLTSSIHTTALGDNHRAPGTTTDWRMGVGAVYNTLWGITPQYLCLFLPSIPGSDAPAFSRAGSWSTFSVGGVGFFPIASLAMFGMMKIFPPTMNLIRRGKTAISLKNVVNTMATGANYAANFVCAYEESVPEIVAGKAMAAYIQAVYILDYLTSRLPQYRDWVYKEEGGSRHFLPDPAGAPTNVGVIFPRNELGGIAEGALDTWTNDGVARLIQFGSRPVYDPGLGTQPLRNESFGRAEEVLINTKDPQVVESYGFELASKTITIQI